MFRSQLATAVTLFLLSSLVLAQEQLTDSWPEFTPYDNSQADKTTAEWEFSLENVRYQGMIAPKRFLSVDRFADKYPSLSPYQYTANNPILFVDANGDSIVITEAMANSGALANYANTKEGYNYLSQFAYEGQEITINGQTFTFTGAGKHSTQNIVFMGTKADAGTTPVNSISGRGYVNTQKGVQSYEIYLSDSKIVGERMDDAFHEVQHASMFAGGGFSGKLSGDIMDRHHGAMMQLPLWSKHEMFISQANSRFGTNLSSQNIYEKIYNQIQKGPNAPIIIQMLHQNKKIRY